MNLKTMAIEKLSARLMEIVSALPLHPGVRVLEIGCGPGAAARAIVKAVDESYVLGIDRSEKAIRQAIKSSGAELASGRLSFRQVAVEEFVLAEGEPLFDIAFAVRVGVLDGRHPQNEVLALQRIKKALKPGGRVFIDGGDPLLELRLPDV